MAVKTPSMPEGLKNISLNEALIHEVVVALQANVRQNTASTKDRSEVSGGGRKPWRQKGTGRARHGSNRSPIWRGGGVTFGPRPERNFKKAIPDKKKRQALLQVVAQKIKEKNLAVTSDIKLTEPKTRYAAEFLKKSLGDKFSGRVILIIEKKNEDIFRAFRNLPFVNIRTGLNFNIYDLLYNDFILFTDRGWENFLEKRQIK